MGIWDYISYAGDSLKNTADLSSVKSLYGNSKHYISSAAVKVGTAVKVHGVDKVSYSLRDQEGRAEMARVAGTIAINTAYYACQEGLKTLPGGVLVYKALKDTVRGGKVPEQKDEIKALQEKLSKMEEELNVCKTLIQHKQQEKVNNIGLNHHVTSPGSPGSSESTLTLIQQQQDPYALCINKKPKDVLRVFMMTEFVGSRHLDHLIIPGVRSSEGK